MVQCEDGRRRQARVHGVPRQEGEFEIWNAGVRLKGKHVREKRGTVTKPRPGIF